MQRQMTRAAHSATMEKPVRLDDNEDSDAMPLPAEKDMREAVSARDTAYDGRFYYGVVTTGIFCRPSCGARPPRPENLRFFPHPGAAIAAGFRPCKRCRPLAGSGIDKLVDVARHIERHANETLTLASLSKRAGLSASRLQRSFKAAFGISPKAFQDACRMRRFKSALKGGDEVTGAIFSAGFGSTSRVYGEAAHSIGMTPKAYRGGGENETIAYACRRMSLGYLMMAATDKGVCFVEFADQAEHLIDKLRSEFPKATLVPSPAGQAPELDAWLVALDRHISAGEPRPDLPLDLRGTAFQVKVWRFLLSVREGDVLSYGEVAEGIDRPTAARAVARACAANRLGVLVPCHRVLRGNGEIGGYRWGPERKRALLARERRQGSRSS